MREPVDLALAAVTCCTKGSDFSALPNLAHIVCLAALDPLRESIENYPVYRLDRTSIVAVVPLNALAVGTGLDSPPFSAEKLA